MAKYCTNCGKELDENAALCLNCGVLVENKIDNNNNNKEVKKGIPTWAIVLIIVGSILLLPLIFLLLIGIFTYNVVDKITNNIDEYVEEEIITQYGTIDDTLFNDEIKITLNKTLMYSSIGEENNIQVPEEGKEYLIFFFDIENISNENIYISKYDFNGYSDSYKTSVFSLYDKIDGVNELSDNLPPKKKTNGYVAFEVDKSWHEFEIHYSSLYNYEDEFIFTVVNTDNDKLSA